MAQNNFSKPRKLWFLCGLILSTNVYAYNFSGTYAGNSKTGIINLQIENNQVEDVFVKCSNPDCNLRPATKSLFLNYGGALISELKPFGDEKLSTAYTTLILTPTNNPNKIQSVLVGYRAYVKPTEKDIKYKAEYSLTEILTKI